MGGEDFVVEQETRLLESQGHQVFRLEEDNRRINDISKVELVASAFWNQKAADALTDIIRKESIDVVHVHNYFPLLSPSVFKAADVLGVPLVHTAHNFRLICLNGLLFRDGRDCHDCPTLGNFLPGAIHRCYRSSLAASTVGALTLSWHKAAKTITGTVDCIVALGQFAAKELEAGGISKSLVRVKPNFLFLDPTAGSGTGSYVAYAGRLSPEKGITTLVDAWQALKQPIPLKIAGSGQLSEQVETLARAIPFVSYEGWLAESELISLLQNARFMVLPSVWKELQPIIVLQALACGTPIVMSDACAAVDEIVSSGAGVAFRSGDVDSLANTSQELFFDVPRLLQMRLAARELFVSRFTANANYAKLMEIYAAAIDARRQKQNR